MSTRAGAAVLLFAVSAIGVTASPADASPAAEREQGARKVLAAPRSLETEVSGRTVRISWRRPVATSKRSVDRYEVRYRQAGDATWSTPVSTTKQTARVTDLVGGSRASFVVRAVDEGRKGRWSGPVTAMPMSRPSAVRLLTAATPDRTLRITWQKPARSGGRAVDRYEVMYRTTGSGSWRHVQKTVERATLTDLRNSKKYSFRVRAHNAVGWSAWTEVVRARPGAAPQAVSTAVMSAEQTAVAGRSAIEVTPVAVEPPGQGSSGPTSAPQSSAASEAVQEAAPGGVLAVSAVPALDSVRLTWAAPTGGGRVDSYEVRTRVSGSTSWTVSPDIGTTAAEVSGLLVGVSYDFSIRAIGAAPGEWTAPVEATPGTPTAPETPKLRFTGRALAMRISWSADGIDLNGGALSGWEVRYRTSGASAWTAVDVADPDGRSVETGSVPRGFTYSVIVRARTAVGSGSWSSAASLYAPVLTLPVLNVETADSAPVVSRDDYLSASFSLDTDDVASDGTTYPTISGTTEIKGRGNSTWDAPKKPYRLKLSTKTALLGMPANKNWVLLANAYDHSLLRNDTALYLGTKTGLAWTPRTRYVEVMLNGDYLGLYQLAEQVRIDTGRIDIKSMKATDSSGTALTGGYQLERDGRWDAAEEAGFTSSMDQPMVIKDPEAPTTEQSAYIHDYFNDFETALQSEDRGDPTTGYAAYIDVDSFVDWYIVEEYTQNADAGFASVDLYKPRNGKLTMGPLWDFDLGFENDGRLYAKRHVWWVKNGPWWREFFKDPAWEARVEARWHVLRASIPSVEAHLRATQAIIETAAVGDAKRWGGYGDHDVQIDIVRDFLVDRGAWLDAQWGTD